MMNFKHIRLIVCAALGAACTLLPAASTAADDPGTVGGYVTPFYDSSGPKIQVGQFSAGLGSKNPAAFVATIRRMKSQFGTLTFAELYVAAIRLYDQGYRNEGVYWFYCAQYQGRLFGSLVDQDKMGSMGSPGFELYHAQDAFFQIAGPTINGYAFGHLDELVKIIQQVRAVNKNVPNMQAIYHGVTFIPRAQWADHNAKVASGLGDLAQQIESQKGQIQQQRAKNGTQARFEHVTSRQFPGGF